MVALNVGSRDNCYGRKAKRKRASVLERRRHFVICCAISMALWRRVVCELMQCLWCAGLWSALIVVTIYLLGFWGRLAIVILAVAGLGSLLQVVSKAIAGEN